MLEREGSVRVYNLLARIAATDAVKPLTYVVLRQISESICCAKSLQFAAIPSCTGDGPVGPEGGAELVFVTKVVDDGTVGGVVEVIAGAVGLVPSQSTQYSCPGTSFEQSAVGFMARKKSTSRAQSRAMDAHVSPSIAGHVIVQSRRERRRASQTDEPSASAATRIAENEEIDIGKSKMRRSCRAKQVQISP